MPSDEMVEKVARAICNSGKFETRQGGCAALCMSMLGRSRPNCAHALEVHGKLAIAALAAAEAGESVAWSDIASAPKDGTWVLLKGGEPDEDYDFDAPKPPCVVARWVALHPTGGRWYFASYDSGYYGKWFDPTHWRPVASPPSEASRNERALLDQMGKHTNWELSCSGGWSDDPLRWTVHEVTGGRNDREWTVIGEGETPAEALATAIRARGTAEPTFPLDGDTMTVTLTRVTSDRKD